MLNGSPFAVGVAPAAADPAKCVASLDGAVSSGRRVEAGKELLVTVQLRDSFGNITQQAGTTLMRSAVPATCCVFACPSTGQASAFHLNSMQHICTLARQLPQAIPLFSTAACTPVGRRRQRSVGGGNWSGRRALHHSRVRAPCSNAPHRGCLRRDRHLQRQAGCGMAKGSGRRPCVQRPSSLRREGRRPQWRDLRPARDADAFHRRPIWQSQARRVALSSPPFEAFLVV